MGKWRDAFESSLPPPEKRQYQEEYLFGPPATHDQLALAEQELGRALPQEVREMLLEFNGVWCKTKFGGEPEIVLLDTNHIAHEVPHHLRTCGNQQPPDEELAKVVFVYQQNGFADLYGVCAEDFGDFRDMWCSWTTK